MFISLIESASRGFKRWSVSQSQKYNDLSKLNQRGAAVVIHASDLDHSAPIAFWQPHQPSLPTTMVSAESFRGSEAA